MTASNTASDAAPVFASGIATNDASASARGAATDYASASATGVAAGDAPIAAEELGLTAAVLMPCLNAEPWLSDAIDSLDRQTYGAFDVVAVDDGSTDGTLAMLEAWAARRAGVTVLSQPHAGVGAALRLATQHTTADVLVRMDADDIAAAERLHLQLQYLAANPAVGACGTHVRYFSAGRVADGARRYEAWLNGMRSPADIERDLFVECPIAHPTLAVRRAVLLDAGSYEDPEWPEDYDLVFRLWSNGRVIGVVPEVLHHWRDSPGRASRTQPRYSPAAFRRCKVHYLLRTKLDGRAAVIVGTGPTGKAFGRELVRQGGRVEAWLDLDPRKIGQQIHGAPVLHADAATEFRNCLVLAAVGSHEGRARVREDLTARGLREGDDFIAVA